MNAIFFNDFKNAHIPEILEEIYLKKVYDPYLLGKTDLTILDVGANIGLTSFFFKDFGKVYSLEPSKIHFDTLSELIKYNKIENVIPVKVALSNSIGKTRFYHNDNSTMFSMEDKVNNKGDFEEVDTTTLEEFIKVNKIENIDLLKLDTEGSESKIIVSDGFKNVANKIKVIVGEYHDWTDMNKIMFKQTFEDLGFTFNWNFKTQASVFSAVRL